MKIKETAGLIKYVYQYKVIAFLPLIFVMNCLMYIFMPIGVIIQGLMTSVSSVYFVNIISQIYVSDMIRSSEKNQKHYLKNQTVMLLISNLIHFLVFIVPSFLFIMSTSGIPKVVASSMLGNYILANIGVFAAISVIYKKQVLGMLFLFFVTLIFGLQLPLYLTNVMKNRGKLGEAGVTILPNIPMWAVIGLLVLAFGVCIVSPLIYYGISKLMKNVPISKAYADRLPWGKV